MLEDVARYARKLLRAHLADQAASEERLVTGQYKSLEAYREEVGYRRALAHSHSLILEALDADTREAVTTLR